MICMDCHTKVYSVEEYCPKCGAVLKQSKHEQKQTKIAHRLFLTF